MALILKILMLKIPLKNNVIFSLPNKLTIWRFRKFDYSYPIRFPILINLNVKIQSGFSQLKYLAEASKEKKIKQNT